MNKKTAFLFIGIILALSFVSASEKIANMPDYVSSFEQWKIMVLQANEDNGFLSVTSTGSWGLCEQTCERLPWSGDCNPCGYGEVSSLCTWHKDSMSSMSPSSSANSYCNQVLKTYNYYNKQCFCKAPSTQCSGGADSGERKCQSGDVWECSNSGVWEYMSNCDYGCSSGTCESQQCSDHEEKKCYDKSVYWYDSCGEKQEEYERCEDDEVCDNARCVKTCDEGFIGESLCSGNKIVQQYQFSNCTTEIREIENCPLGCQNSQCINPSCEICPQPSSWSQCQDEEMFRTNYECNDDTNYKCDIFTETENCECGTSSQCDYDEVCKLNVCVKSDCSENQVADNHECVDKSTISTTMIIIISLSVIMLIFLMLLIFLFIKMKGGNKNVKK